MCRVETCGVYHDVAMELEDVREQVDVRFQVDVMVVPEVLATDSDVHLEATLVVLLASTLLLPELPGREADIPLVRVIPVVVQEGAFVDQLVDDVLGVPTFEDVSRDGESVVGVLQVFDQFVEGGRKVETAVAEGDQFSERHRHVALLIGGDDGRSFPEPHEGLHQEVAVVVLGVVHEHRDRTVAGVVEVA